MGGMCAGSLLLPRYVKTDQHPLRVYGLLELGIAVLGVIVLIGLPLTGKAYITIGGTGAFGLISRALFCAIWLLPPTILMGATLPAIARWVETTPRGISWMGFFYGGNIVGAVVGSLMAGFYLLRVHDMTVASLVAVGLNVAVGVAGLQLAKATSYVPTVAPDARPTTPVSQAVDADQGSRRAIYVAIALSGMTALAAEGVWTRLVTLLLGGTVYTFSMILGVVLIGLGIGSTIGATLERSIANPRLALGWCQLLLVGTIGYAAYMLGANIPFWPINPGLSSNPWYTLQIDFVRCLVALLPSAILWGASFPLALGSVARRGEDPGRLVGRVYAANTVGAIFGSILGSVVLIQAFGTQNAQRLLLVVAAVSAAIVFISAFPRRRQAGLAYVGVATLAAVFFASVAPPILPQLIGYGRYMATRQYDQASFIFWDEGMNSSMAVSELSNGVRNYHNAGKIQASSEPQDMRLQRMLGHLTTLLPANPSSVLVIGCGAGVTAGATSINPDVSKVTIAEIEKLVPKFVATYFGDHNYNVVDNPKTEIHIDDARHFLVTTDQKFDAITSDPFDPWVKGAANLYSREFWQIAKDHLNPGGVVTVFVQLYESGTAAVKSEIATFRQVFPNAIIFANTVNGQGYDVVLVGQKDPGPIDIDEVQRKLSDPRYAAVAQSLAEIGMYSAVDLFSTFSGQGPMLDAWLADAEINTDRNLRLQFLAGLGVNAWEQVDMYRNMIANRRYPENLFQGSPDHIDALRNAMFYR
jgi:spermidine synthase